MTDYTIDDMINSVIDKRPETFKDAFNSIMSAKVAAAIENKKQEVASAMFNDNTEPEEAEGYDDSLELEDPDLENQEAEEENAEDSETNS